MSWRPVSKCSQVFAFLCHGRTSDVLLPRIHRLRINQTVSTRSYNPTRLLQQDRDVQKPNPMDLKTVASKLETFAPTSLAESWDNVGLLVEPSHPHIVKNILLTNDLTPEVLEEACQKEVNMILSYHPPIFASLKRLTQGPVKERLIVKCIENRIAVYSPHTCYDALQGGVNDWLISPFGPFSQCDPISVSTSPDYPTQGGIAVNTRVPANVLHDFLAHLEPIEGVEILDSSGLNSSGPDLRLHLVCKNSSFTRLMDVLLHYKALMEFTEMVQLVKPPLPGHGMGRIGVLEQPITLEEAVDKVKKHLGLNYVQVAVGNKCSMKSQVNRVAVCAGSGNSVLQCTPADLYVTGEMSHHEILAAVSKGTSVIICNHSNTERGFLHVLREKFNTLFDGAVNVTVSETDEDPLKTM